MDEATRKPMLTPSNPLIDAGFEGGGEQSPPKPLVGGSIPSGPAKLVRTRVSTADSRSEGAQKAPATMRTPKTLPDVPTEEELRAVLREGPQGPCELHRRHHDAGAQDEQRRSQMRVIFTRP